MLWDLEGQRPVAMDSKNPVSPGKVTGTAFSDMWEWVFVTKRYIIEVKAGKVTSLRETILELEASEVVEETEKANIGEVETEEEEDIVKAKADPW